MKKTVLFLILIIFSLPQILQAQMFSVDDDERSRTNPFAPYLRAGIKTINFDYQGDPEENNAGVLNLQGVAATLAFESGGFKLGASIANKLTGVDDQNYFDLAINFTNPFMIIGRPTYMIGLPLQLGSKVTSVRSDITSHDFSQTNFHAGIGIMTQFHFPELLGGSIQFLPSYGFSSSSGGFVGGNVFSLKGQARINFYNIIFDKNISLGYDYNFDSYDIDGETLDYNFTGHTLTLGISL